MISLKPQMNLVLELSMLHSKMLKRIESQLSMHGISFTEFLVLYQLNNAHQQTMRRVELAEHVGLTASGVTRLLAPMEKRKLVQRQVNEWDARVSLVQLTEMGQQLFVDALNTFEHSATSVMQALDDTQLRQMHELTEKLM